MRVFDPAGRKIDEIQTMCVPVDETVLREGMHQRHRSERLWVQGFVGVAFALLALATLAATINAPADKRWVGYLGVLIWLAVSTVGWISFRNVFRDDRIRAEWNEREAHRDSPADRFLAEDDSAD